MDTLTFSPATRNDLDRIMHLEASGFAASNRESRAVYAQRIEAFAGGSLLARLGAETIGCMFCEIWPATPVLQAEHFALGHDIRQRHDPQHGSELYIASMTIAPEFRGRRLGLPLLTGGIDHVARAHPRVRSALLLVNATWTRAQRIYVHAGFKEIARFDGFFTGGDAPAEDGVVMRRALPFL